MIHDFDLVGPATILELQTFDSFLEEDRPMMIG